MKKVFLFPVVALVILLQACSEKPESIKAVFKDLSVSVYASAEVKPKDYYLVYPTSAGIIEEWLVQVGDSVLKGQLIAQIENDNSVLQVESASLSAELASEKYLGKANLLKSINTEISATQQQLKVDSMNYVRLSKLQAKSIGSQVEYESGKLKYELSKSRMAGLVQRLNQTKIELKNAYLQSQKNLKSAVTQLDDFGVRSIINGKIFDIKAKSGELVNMQKPIASIGDAKTFIVEMWVDEKDISLIRMDQVFHLTLDAYPQDVFRGRISKIYPEKNYTNQSFKLEGRFDTQPGKLFAGLSGEANIVLEKKSNVLVIPQRFMLNDSTVKTAKETLIVTTGAKDMSLIEITSGIDSNTVIILPTQE